MIGSYFSVPLSQPNMACEDYSMTLDGLFVFVQQLAAIKSYVVDLNTIRMY